MKIMHVGEYIKGGVYTYLFDVLEYQSKFQNALIYLVASEYKSEKEYPVEEDNIFFYKYRRNPFYMIYATIYIFILIKKVKPDIIHVHSTFAGLFVRLPYLLLPNKNVEIIYCSHGWSFLMETSNFTRKLYIQIEKNLSKVTNKIINISMFEQIESIKVGITKNKSVLIYNGTKKINDEKLYSPTLNNIDKTKINILFVGRFDRQKGIDILINLIEDISNKQIHFYLIGDSVLGNKQNTNFKLPENATKIGWIKNEEIDDYYQSVDAVIIPSRWEGFGLVAIEAMKNKKAVISSNRGALPELIQNDINGYIFDMDNLKSLKLIIEKLDKNTLKDLGENGYTRYLKYFTSEKMNNEILTVYNSLISQEKIIKKDENHA
ncbi:MULTISPECIES: glycosyltransferase [Bacillaceae]|uniref:glycosyltransferase n=1 Tax=Bacillaceae TaxID=186817 RepID=UPI000660D496|nr:MULTISPECIES: glycosyltransferase [Bacillaceae]MCF7623650.1 glycosyltransferase [Peribacillus frigoritolerans]